MDGEVPIQCLGRDGVCAIGIGGSCEAPRGFRANAPRFDHERHPLLPVPFAARPQFRIQFPGRAPRPRPTVHSAIVINQCTRSSTPQERDTSL